MPSTTHPAQAMRAIVFKGPYKVAVEDLPIPKIVSPGDIIVKVKYAGLCGTELHMYRGHQKTTEGFILGHEFTGTVVQVGDAVKSVKLGDEITSPFSTTCSECFYCKKGLSSRCTTATLIGTPALDGAQAEYVSEFYNQKNRPLVRVPYADGTVVKAPPEINEQVLILMADIFPTGYFAASNGYRLLNESEREDAVVVVVGCGPVGLCALVSATKFRPKHLFAIDSVPSRLEQARLLGAEPLNFQTDMEGLKKRIKEVTDGRGADLCLEIVGLSPALRLAFDLIRPWGVISSVGVHNGEVPWTANEAYHKNLRMQTGRCSVRSVFPEALELLKEKQHIFMADNIIPLDDAVDAYDRFEKAKVQKIVFKMPSD
ncbi:hypothetical protein B7463_g5089, partial [Scytalidium lignicola]